MEIGGGRPHLLNRPTLNKKYLIFVAIDICWLRYLLFKICVGFGFCWLRYLLVLHNENIQN